MKKIGVISDTHGSLHPRVREFLSIADQIWHAGDIGTMELADELEQFKPLVAVYGNIDNAQLRTRYHEISIFAEEGLKVLIKHIGGYPGKYFPDLRNLIITEKPGLVICGHSHILKILWDKQMEHLHMNPGAAGSYGIHQKITAVRFDLENGRMSNLEILEIPRYSSKH